MFEFLEWLGSSTSEYLQANVTLNVAIGFLVVVMLVSIVMMMIAMWSTDVGAKCAHSDRDKRGR